MTITVQRSWYAFPSGACPLPDQIHVLPLLFNVADSVPPVIKSKNAPEYFFAALS